MDKPIKRISKLPSNQNFDEIDHRLACGWHTEVDPSGQRKRFLRSLLKDAEKIV
tara:strand:+ start:361 stop:522 length:162 start_codon:yes stop_codon:yes gene_type:complete